VVIVAAGKRQSDVGAPSPVAQSYDEYAREQVAELQRARILTAMVDECFERGVAGVSVAHVVSRSGVSRRTFYDVFSDREDCFLAAFERALSLAHERVLEACEGQRSWLERIRAGLVAFLGLLEDEPRLGRVLVCESAAGGPRVLQRRAEAVELVARAVDEGRTLKGVPKGRAASKGRAAGGEFKGASELSPLTAEGIVGGVLAVIQVRLAQSPAREVSHKAARGGGGNAARKESPRPLLELAGPLMSTIVLPYLGPAAARRELARPVARSAPGTGNGVMLADPFKAAGLRLTYRTVRVLMAIAQQPGASNRRIGELAGVVDQGQISKLLHRLERGGLIENTGAHASKGMPNAWMATEKGHAIQRAIQTPRESNPKGRTLQGTGRQVLTRRTSTHMQNTNGEAGPDEHS
jgi:AcrR family transcriptional regulator/DNA-binding MarR family transcriptional regulator